MTEIGGLALALRFVAKMRVAQRIDKALSLLRVHRAYFESDHVLTHIYNLFSGGTCIEDIGHLQHSEPIRRLLGTKQIPDPTTAGDFLRRFEASDIDRHDRVGDAIWQDVWKHSYGRKRQAEVLICRASRRLDHARHAHWDTNSPGSGSRVHGAQKKAGRKLHWLTLARVADDGVG